MPVKAWPVECRRVVGAVERDGHTQGLAAPHARRPPGGFGVSPWGRGGMGVITDPEGPSLTATVHARGLPARPHVEPDLA